MSTPVEARCDGCRQTRALFLYEPDCGVHLGANAFTCPWCSIERQPLLCPPCWSARKEREERDEQRADEIAVLEQICAANRRAEERREGRHAADRETCEGIAAATEKAGGVR